MIRPLRDRIVVEPQDKPLSSVLEIIQFEEKHHRGKVIAVGPQVKFEDDYLPRGPTDSKPGDMIQFTDAFKFPVIMDHGAKRLILQEADICGIEVSA